MAYYCHKCKKDISPKVYSYSMDKFGEALCYGHQRSNRGRAKREGDGPEDAIINMNNSFLGIYKVGGVGLMLIIGGLGVALLIALLWSSGSVLTNNKFAITEGLCFLLIIVGIILKVKKI